MISHDDSTDTDLDLTFEGGRITQLNYLAGVQFPPGSPDAIAFIEELLNSDPSNMRRTKIRHLPNDDPDKDTDPARPDLRWSDPRGRPNDELIGQSTEYLVRFSAGKYQYSSRRLS